MESLPEKFKGISQSKETDLGQITETHLVKPGKNQVLVKIHYAPINPSDLSSLKKHYPISRSATFVGFEASGVIAAVGEDLKVNHQVGEKVHVGAIGTWAQYAITDSERCFKIQGNISMEEAACHVVNPGTAVLMAQEVQNGGHKAAVHTAGSSALGRMMIKYFKEKGIKLISIVRKQQYVDELLKEGADYVLNSTSEGFAEKLKEVCEKESATIAFDAIAGDFTGTLLSNMPRKSTVQVYGGLGGSSVSKIALQDLLFQGKSISGLWLTEYMSRINMQETIKFFTEIHKNLSGSLKSTIQKVFPFEEYKKAIELQEEKGSDGKILLQFS